MIQRKFFLLFLLILFLPGCASVVSKNLRDQADQTLTFQQVFQNPNGYKGKVVIWGGEIIETVNRKDGTTSLEIFQRPLGWRDEPRETLDSGGRFIALVEKYLDSYLFRKGAKITVAGEVSGEEVRPVGQLDYRYPVVSGKQVYLWQDYAYLPALAPPYSYYYDPWWPYPYGPWPGWRFHYYHPR